MAIEAGTGEVEGSVQPKLRQARKIPKRKLLFLIFTSLIIISGVVGTLYVVDHKSPIPKYISKSVNFPVFYPDPKKLPAGYWLDKASISAPQPNTVLYKVNFGQTKKWVFSLQEKLSDEEIQSFYANYIPLRNKLDVPLGHVEIGAYNNKGTVESVISLPITGSNTWILITGPADYDQGQLEQLLGSIRR